MKRSKSIRRKLSNILLLLVFFVIAFGVYFKVYNSKSEKKSPVEVGENPSAIYAVTSEKQETTDNQEQAPNEQAPQTSTGPSQDLPQGDAPQAIATATGHNAIQVRWKPGDTTAYIWYCTDLPDSYVDNESAKKDWALKWDENAGHYHYLREVRRPRRLCGRFQTKRLCDKGFLLPIRGDVWFNLLEYRWRCIDGR